MREDDGRRGVLTFGGTEFAELVTVAYIASNAKDAEDCAELLAMLGITSPKLGYRWVTSGSGNRRRVEDTP